MFRPAIAAGTGAERAEQVDLGKKVDVIARAHRRRLHEILAGVAGEARAHENVQHVMDLHLDFL